MPQPVCFRLSDEAMSIIIVHASDLSVSHGRDVDRTAALEDIIMQFANKSQKGLVTRLRKKLHPEGSSALTVFLEAEHAADIREQTLEDARH